MASDLREHLHQRIDQLPDHTLPDLLHLLDLLASDDVDDEIEVLWLLASGTLKQLVDEIDHAPPPVDDWRGRLREL